MDDRSEEGTRDTIERPGAATGREILEPLRDGVRLQDPQEHWLDHRWF